MASLGVFKICSKLLRNTCILPNNFSTSAVRLGYSGQKTSSDQDSVSSHLQLRENTDKFVRKIARTRNADGTLTIEGRNVPNELTNLIVDNKKGACPLCSLGLEVKYTDVLIIKQFLKKDGRLLARRHTGLCAKQQRNIDRLAHMAHNAGLLSSLRPPLPDNRQRKPDKLSTYSFKGLNRYFTSNY